MTPRVAPAADPRARGGEAAAVQARPARRAGAAGAARRWRPCQGSPSGPAIRTSPPRLTSARLAELPLDRGGDQVGGPGLADGAEVEGGAGRDPDARRRGSSPMPARRRGPGARVGRRAAPCRRASRSWREVAVVAELDQGPAEQRVDQPAGLLGGLAGDLDRGDQQRVDLDPLARRPVGAGQVGVVAEPAAGRVDVGQHPLRRGGRRRRGRRAGVRPGKRRCRARRSARACASGHDPLLGAGGAAAGRRRPARAPGPRAPGPERCRSGPEGTLDGARATARTTAPPPAPGATGGRPGPR